PRWQIKHNHCAFLESPLKL
ncbi:hypothetical protein STIAU_5662, partial [Stigmatella aurantiaca DW4/3-1]